ncbi:hypothetical protein FOZ63_018052 [Perkinsus olseni]|uniref:Uncharacterized protein n=1 Tax=Perkinsus olseni TaxID=32597 RepID=A0A7J6TWQ8_PEROL|nr:hypothetical protein FOZ63_018052 [Perkinsus olseni]
MIPSQHFPGSVPRYLRYVPSRLQLPGTERSNWSRLHLKKDHSSDSSRLLISVSSNTDSLGRREHHLHSLLRAHLSISL